MNRNVLLVAAREFRQIAAMKSFWLTLLLVPVALAIGPLLGSSLDEEEATRVVVLDRAGGSAAIALEQRFGFEEERSVLRSLSRYVRRHGLENADPDAPWAQHDRWYTDADVLAFRQSGGVEGAVAQIDEVRPDGTPEFDIPEPEYSFAPAPAALASAQAEELQSRVDALLDGGEDVPEGEAADYVLLVGEGYPADPTIRLWSKDQPRSSFVSQVQEVLTADLRQRLLTDQGIPASQAAAIQGAAPAIAVTTPPPGGGAREALLIRSIVPLALSYILMLSLMLSGSWMLQGSVEERSNKLLESLLACIRPEELMQGKLLGALAVGFSMIGVWVGCAIVVAFFTQGEIADMIRPALEPVSSPTAIIAMIYFFVMGYIAVSIIFVAIGAMADSMSEAQGYLMPVLLGILLPITFLLSSLVAGKDGLLVQILTWVPLWTPFAVLARLGMGIEWWEMIGSGILLAGFVALEVVFLGRLFRASLLATGQKPGFKQLMERFKAPA
ncbi:ABC transporter permease [Qipengyuania sp. XHP0211]|uniref:ABC transporter permease n=1 Tax=Qipengyuania sp. XHP0211 TaxID=3038079 RepID=UPI002420464E|nr:ABC transporter permease [Qipengyuania sp. XHP0211]MDG5752086.1 ABC transporter permease [Qipengyuania sp. XHP0211]